MSTRERRLKKSAHTALYALGMIAQLGLSRPQIKEGAMDTEQRVSWVYSHNRPRYYGFQGERWEVSLVTNGD